MCVFLVRVLFMEFILLMLDEFINYLDFNVVIWFNNYF